MLDLTNIAVNALFGGHLFLVLCVAFGTDTTPYQSHKGATSTGVAITMVLMVVLPISRLLEDWATYLQAEHFLLVGLSLLCFGTPIGMEKCLREISPVVWRYLGRPLGRLGTNAGILGAVLLADQARLTVVESMVYGLFSGLSLILVLVCFVGIVEDIRITPKWLQGAPMLFLTAGLMALPLMGFYGLVIS
ncbi:MAG: Rnf-Nqr domain containing protein [Eubacteriales bacterium]